MSKKAFLSLTLCLALNLSVFGRALAVEVVIEGNSSGSSNEVQIASESTTTVSQENNTEVNNNVENNANTGGNESNNNSGDTSIQTGDANTTTNVNNENLNSNFAQNETCECEHTLDVKISGNGSNTTNTVSAGLSNSGTVNQTNNASIKNNIAVKANTGYNSANNNTGNVGIKTGSITSITTINNKNINNSYSMVVMPSISTQIQVNGNGSFTNNIVNLNIQKSLITNTTNNANIVNNVFTYLNTGKNNANGNTGDAFILTGDIFNLTTINNENINSSFIHVDCECETDNPNPTPTITPPPSPTNKPCVDNCGGGNPANGSVGGASAGGNSGDVLPATGSYYMYLVTLASLIMFFSGWYLRFRSGVAPGK